MTDNRRCEICLNTNANGVTVNKDGICSECEALAKAAEIAILRQGLDAALQREQQMREALQKELEYHKREQSLSGGGAGWDIHYDRAEEIRKALAAPADAQGTT